MRRNSNSSCLNSSQTSNFCAQCLMRYFWDDKARKWVDWPDRPPQPRIHYITDHADPFRSQGDGKIYDSKSKYRKSLKEQGYVELGSEPIESYMREPKPEPLPTLREVAAKEGFEL